MKRAITMASTAVVLALSALGAQAGSSTTDAAIGGGLGGAAGAAIGNEVGGRDGAILGGAVGAAVGTAVTTDGDDDRAPRARVRVHEEYEYAPARGGHPFGYHCPPGQHKKGRC